MRRTLGLAFLLPLFACPAAAQHYQTDFPPEEFRARWLGSSARTRRGKGSLHCTSDIGRMWPVNGRFAPWQRQLRVPEENLNIRYEDTVVVTENGVENFTDLLPSELADLEKLVLEKGVVQNAPAEHVNR